VKNNLTPILAYPKIKHYCSYRERCQFEVKEKLFTMGLSKADVDEMLSRLIGEDILNEERFCVQFAGSHFRQKKWGKVKIIHALKQKRVSEPNIKKALREIEDADYQVTLRKTAQTKWNLLKNEQYISRQAKTTAYLLQKGYEAPMIREVIRHIREEKNKD